MFLTAEGKLLKQPVGLSNVNATEERKLWGSPRKEPRAKMTVAPQKLGRSSLASQRVCVKHSQLWRHPLMVRRSASQADNVRFESYWRHQGIVVKPNCRLVSADSETCEA